MLIGKSLFFLIVLWLHNRSTGFPFQNLLTCFTIQQIPLAAIKLVSVNFFGVLQPVTRGADTENKVFI